LGSALSGSGSRPSSEWRRVSDEMGALTNGGKYYNERGIDVPGEDHRRARAMAIVAKLMRAKIERMRAAKAAAASRSVEDEEESAFPDNSVGSLGSFRTSTGNGIDGNRTEVGSMCNRLGEPEEESSPVEVILDAASSKGEDLEEDGQQECDRLERPPKIWISKSASMEHADLD